MANGHDNHPNTRTGHELTIEERIPAAILRLLMTSLSTLHLKFDPTKVSTATLGDSWFLDVNSPDGLRHIATQAMLQNTQSVFKVAWWREGQIGQQGSYQIDLVRATGVYATKSHVTDKPLSSFDQQQWWRSGGLNWLIGGESAFGVQRGLGASDIELAKLAGDLEAGVVDVDTTHAAQRHFNLNWGEATTEQPPLMLE